MIHRFPGVSCRRYFNPCGLLLASFAFFARKGLSQRTQRTPRREDAAPMTIPERFFQPVQKRNRALAALCAVLELLFPGCPRPPLLTPAPAIPLWLISESGQYGFIDQSGREVIPPRYADAKPFQEGLAAVE